MNLGDERDPNVGLQEDEATFTIPHEPVGRRIHGIETFNVLRGGETFHALPVGIELAREPRLTTGALTDVTRFRALQP
jgi:hypothetical protein